MTVFGIVMRYILPTLIASVFAGAFGMLALADHYAYQKLRAQTITLRNQISGTTAVLQYGTIGEIDAFARTLSIRTENKFAPDGPPIVFSLKVTESTIVAYQTLTGENGTYTGMSTDASHSFSDMKVGDRVAFLMTLNSDGTRTATLLFFGNPL